MSSDSPSIVVYGTNWCPDCIRVRKFLDSRNVAYRWLNINNDLAACEIVQKVNHGNQSVPTIIWPDGTYLVEPSIKQLRDKLGIYD